MIESSMQAVDWARSYRMMHLEFWYTNPFMLIIAYQSVVQIKNCNFGITDPEYRVPEILEFWPFYIDHFPIRNAKKLFVK